MKMTTLNKWFIKFIQTNFNKTSTSDTEASFLDLNSSISNDITGTKFYDKQYDFDFDIVNFSFLDSDVPRATSYGVYISLLIRFSRVSSHEIFSTVILSLPLKGQLSVSGE